VRLSGWTVFGCVAMVAVMATPAGASTVSRTGEVIAHVKLPRVR
jgi:hypothetical protein